MADGKPIRFYCWYCGNYFVTFPNERGEVSCKWCGSRDIGQWLPPTLKPKVHKNG